MKRETAEPKPVWLTDSASGMYVVLSHLKRGFFPGCSSESDVSSSGIGAILIWGFCVFFACLLCTFF